MPAESHAAFFQYVADYAEKHPVVAPHVAQAVEHGLRRALTKANQRAADMETALVFALEDKRKQHRYFIAEKLRKWMGQTALNWDKQLAKLEKE